MTDEKDPGSLTQADLDAQQQAAADEAERHGEDRRAQALAEHRAHPHTRLTELQATLAAPTALDINGRVSALHSVLSRLLQIIKEHTPAPDDPGANSLGD